MTTYDYRIKELEEKLKYSEMAANAEARRADEQAERIKELELLNSNQKSMIEGQHKYVAPPTPETPGKEDASFEHWYETRFKPAMERGPFDRYVARQAWFASKADAIEKGEG